MLIKRVTTKLKTEGFSGLVAAGWRRIAGARLATYEPCIPFLKGKTGLEIGGPSKVFGPSGIVPLYPIAGRLDNCTFSQKTAWEGQIVEGATFQFYKRAKPGNQYIVEASDLSRIPSDSYDFVVSSHVLEHVANPILALHEWIRVLKDEGVFILIVPHKDGTFDHRRPITSIGHLIQDYNANTDESDMTHVDEILKYHDLDRDFEAGGFETFKQRCAKNFEFRCLHHHVFDTRLAVELIDYMGIQIISVEVFRPFHIVVVSQKLPRNSPVKNTHFTRVPRSPPWKSPFPSDRRPP